jgi:hypothetical protein
MGGVAAQQHAPGAVGLGDQRLAGGPAALAEHLDADVSPDAALHDSDRLLGARHPPRRRELGLQHVFAGAVQRDQLRARVAVERPVHPTRRVGEMAHQASGAQVSRNHGAPEEGLVEARLALVADAQPPADEALAAVEPTRYRPRNSSHRPSASRSTTTRTVSPSSSNSTQRQP